MGINIYPDPSTISEEEMHIYDWTDANVEILRTYIEKGCSAGYIARHIPPDQSGVRPSRNAIIGKAHRLGFKFKAQRDTSLPVGKPAHKPAKPAASTVKAATPAARVFGPIRKPPVRKPEPPAATLPKAPVAAPEPPETDCTGRFAILGLTNETCRWPIGEPTSPDFRFCLSQAVEGKPYCPGHGQMAYDPMRSKPRAYHD